MNPKLRVHDFSQTQNGEGSLFQWTRIMYSPFSSQTTHIQAGHSTLQMHFAQKIPESLKHFCIAFLMRLVEEFTTFLDWQRLHLVFLLLLLDHPVLGFPLFVQSRVPRNGNPPSRSPSRIIEALNIGLFVEFERLVSTTLPA